MLYQISSLLTQNNPAENRLRKKQRARDKYAQKKKVRNAFNALMAFKEFKALDRGVKTIHSLGTPQKKKRRRFLELQRTADEALGVEEKERVKDDGCIQAMTELEEGKPYLSPAAGVMIQLSKELEMEEWEKSQESRIHSCAKCHYLWRTTIAASTCCRQINTSSTTLDMAFVHQAAYSLVIPFGSTQICLDFTSLEQSQEDLTPLLPPQEEFVYDSTEIFMDSSPPRQSNVLDMSFYVDM